MDCMSLLSVCADSRFGKPRITLKKVLLVAVRSCGCGVLIRGLRNLESSCEGVRVVTFCIVQKVTKKHARTCKKLPVASFCASETAETGRIANGREQGDHVSRRQESFKVFCPTFCILQKVGKSSPQGGGEAAERQKDLVLFVRS